VRGLTIAVVILGACGPSGGLGGDGGGVDQADAPTNAPDARNGFTDAAPGIDAGNVFDIDATDYGDAISGCGDAWMCPSPIGNGCTGNPGDPESACNGADDDCDGQVDDGCACTPGTVQACFRGPPGKRDVGACQDGQQTCMGSGDVSNWGPCTGGIIPGGEACDTLDNDCNGCADDNPACCQVDLDCPGPGDMPDGQPFVDYVIDGTLFYPGAAISWTWTVVGGPCDQLLDATSGNVSYTLSGENTSTLTFTPTLSGDYTVTVTIETATGPISCTFIIHVRGPGLRFELCWDKTGGGANHADLDLHVHRDGTTTPWFTANPNNNNTINPDDCYYYNCTARSWHCTGSILTCPYINTKVNWGASYSPSPIAECQGTPLGADWTAYGSCVNPRLDVDNIQTAGIPENVNIDVPLDGSTYRAMVHYWGGTVTTHPLVNVYCGGVLKASYGAAPQVTGFTAGGGFGDGPMWRVVDVTTDVTGGVTTDCTTTLLHPSGDPTSYYVTTNTRAY
jgi:hypothetical protein